MHNWCLWHSGTSSNPAVVIGRENWLYHTGNADMEDYCGKRPLSQPVLDSWTQGLKARQIWLTERGIKYLCLLGAMKKRYLILRSFSQF